MKTLKSAALTAMASLGLICSFSLTAPRTQACTRVVYIGDDGYAITGRNLDWKEDIATNLYVYPRGIVRSGYDVADSTLTWTAKYGSVIAVSYDMGTSEGMNEAGLCSNLLYLPTSKYTKANETRLKMSSAMWVNYVLDNFATTEEAVRELRKDVFHIDAPVMPGGSPTTLHMAISDVHGNSAIIEYIDGNLTIYEGKEYRVLTNAPAYPHQLAVAEYWDQVGGLNFLPGTNRSTDRFARASFYIGAIPTNASHEMAVAGVFGVIFNCAVPVGISTPDQPEISSTRWRTVADQRKLVYYYGTTINPSIMWVDLNDFQLTPGSPIMKLDIMNAKRPYYGNVKADMTRSNGFKPLFRY